MDTTTAPEGELLFHIAGALAQFERRLNAERSRAGIEAARRRGKHLGRPADLTPEKIMKVAKIAARIASGPARLSSVGMTEVATPHNFYPVMLAPTDRALADKLELVERADRSARAYDPRIVQVRVTYGDQIRHVLVAGSDGRVVTDFQQCAPQSWPPSESSRAPSRPCRRSPVAHHRASLPRVAP